MKVAAGTATDVGKVRQGNEDSFLAEPPLYAVADGMGGHQGGEVASLLALETVQALHGEEGSEGDLAAEISSAGDTVFERARSEEHLNGMGTTLTAIDIGADGRATLAHVGDSRAYLLRAGSLRQLTEDHTLVARMVRAGEITKAEAEAHPRRNVITRALGIERGVRVDTLDLALMDGDRILLCSDGLTAMVTEDQIQAICETEPDPQRAADRLVRAANRAGGVDNITVVVLDAHGEPGDAPPSEPGVGSAPLLGIDERRRHPALRWIIGVAVALAVLLGGTFGLRAYVDDQWYVGEANGNVAIFRGIPARPLGIRLSSVEVQTDLPVADIEELKVYADLPGGINALDREDADKIVAQMRKDLQTKADMEDGKGGNGKGGNGGGNTRGASPDPGAAG